MNQLQLFLPCAAGVEGFLAEEVHGLTGLMGQDLQTLRGGVLVRASWRDALLLTLHSRLAQRVLQAEGKDVTPRPPQQRPARRASSAGARRWSGVPAASPQQRR